MPSDEILRNFDKTSEVKRLSGKHTMLSTQEDVLALVEHLVPAQVYSNIPGRAHSAFEQMPNSLLQAIAKRVETLTVKHPIMRDIEVSTF